ncbi:MAG: alpha/beta fold hydrolase [Armatimonadota bacterium]
MRALLVLIALLTCVAAQAADTFVIVHGAWGGGWAFREVDKLLSADGNKVFRPSLTGQGERSHLAKLIDIDLDLHIQDVVNQILWEDLHDVVLVGHSYGGMVITGVVDQVPERIKRVVYLDAFLPENGESVETLRKGPGLGFPTDGQFIIPTWIKGTEPLPHDVPHPLKTWTQKIKLTHQDKASLVPSSYILTVDKGKKAEDDTFFPYSERAKARNWPIVIMEGDHNVQWSAPKELVSLLEKEAARPKS